jgi:hypothetical protein
MRQNTAIVSVASASPVVKYNDFGPRASVASPCRSAMIA